jgi:pimeloyl-ACP methyl ester carboxylesterase
MSVPLSKFVEGEPRLHYLEWNPDGRETLILLHGNTAHAWWWKPLASVLDGGKFRLIALDQRGHGDSDWVRPPAYSPADYASDLVRFIRLMGLVRPIVAGHSMGGISVLSFAARFGDVARAAIAIDVAVTSSPQRDRLMTRLKLLPTVKYSDLAIAMARFRLMPKEGAIAPAVMAEIAEHSLRRTIDGRYTFKFDRASFFGSDGLDVLATVARIRIPTLLIRAERSRIMMAEASALAAASNPAVQLIEIPRVSHHVPLECPELLARAITEFVAGVP